MAAWTASLASALPTLRVPVRVCKRGTRSLCGVLPRSGQQHRRESPPSWWIDAPVGVGAAGGAAAEDDPSGPDGGA